MDKEYIAERYKQIQDEICQALERLDGKASFVEELWTREGGGGGRTRILQNGAVIEKGGVNFSAVHGVLPEAVKHAFQVGEQDFFATGVSIVLHPNHPFIPIIHMNIRYFELNDQVRWFGGGIDLTPHYVQRDDAAYFHRQLKDICDRYDPSFYPEFKAFADRYFYIKHRGETRGVGGVFYDRLTPEKKNLSWEGIFDFSCALGEGFAPMYVELVNRNRHRKFSETNKQWQYLRRGRYVEFNLVYDAGTKFGLETNGRIESILMSLPPHAGWTYDFKPKPDSAEAETVSWLRQGVDWLAQ
ncbi:oxygen-dependent coproporphyrinogen oxidase [Parapedobacter indicus]|uniref:coproporphyrinogen oxidase n=1 Tax=Parapedobacter indicus TaxID=1477437 RepID=A0A1I3DX78_9SPHI|nr:oxygen-dependent coproporphyrinogen oxidase [Parapedobacter indicus]PPL04879.1 coproporphyrinogen oxidase [Parapedobacter indicus]SFH91347.1 coproporphyrinogen oxidase [Parapedobacter indicus]